jgi:hypothetical protein
MGPFATGKSLPPAIIMAATAMGYHHNITSGILYIIILKEKNI